jgi:hypothetical protein
MQFFGYRKWSIGVALRAPFSVRRPCYSTDAVPGPSGDSCTNNELLFDCPSYEMISMTISPRTSVRRSLWPRCM